MGAPWTEQEVIVAVEDYFNMLKFELTNQPYNKSAHRRKLMPQLDQRSDGSVELKHQNISAVLIEQGMPFISGYKPRSNYQKLLEPIVIQFLNANPELFDLFEQDAISPPTINFAEDEPSLKLVAPPSREVHGVNQVSEKPQQYRVNKINYLEMEAQNQKLGEAGEQLVLKMEKSRLIQLGKDNLADKVEQVSVTEGPSAGFDILSFDSRGKDKYIEVKTTKYGITTPFFITPNEVRFSERHSDKYDLYRLFEFRKSPKFYNVTGNVADRFGLEAALYRARL